MIFSLVPSPGRIQLITASKRLSPKENERCERRAKMGQGEVGSWRIRRRLRGVLARVGEDPL